MVGRRACIMMTPPRVFIPSKFRGCNREALTIACQTLVYDINHSTVGVVSWSTAVLVLHAG